MSEESFETRFTDLAAFVEGALSTIQGGEMPDLSNMDERVSILCKEVETAGKSAAEQTQPLMASLISKLDELARALSDHQKNTARNAVS